MTSRTSETVSNIYTIEIQVTEEATAKRQREMSVFSKYVVLPSEVSSLGTLGPDPSHLPI